MNTVTILLIGFCLAVLAAAAPVPAPEISSNTPACTSHGFCWDLVPYQNGTCVKEKECSFQRSCGCNHCGVDVGKHYGLVNEEKRGPGVTGYDIDEPVHD